MLQYSSFQKIRTDNSSLLSAAKRFISSTPLLASLLIGGCETDSSTYKNDAAVVDGFSADASLSKECKPLIGNGRLDNKFNFVFAFYGLTQSEIDQKGSDIILAQFFRSQYKTRAADPDFGFVSFDQNYFQTRAGLFEIEPFKSESSKFNVFYISVPLSTTPTAYQQAANSCSFIKSIPAQNYSLILLKRANTPSPPFNSWHVEELGTAFNHEIGHILGKYADEYFTTMAKNNLSAAEIVDWNARLLNCDYGKPTEQEMQTGNGYCTKWCKGVDPTTYAIYLQSRQLYDACEGKLRNKNDALGWANFCQQNLNFTRFFQYYRFYPGIVINGNQINTQSIQAACSSAFEDTSNNRFYNSNIESFCYSGSLYNVWDLNLGKDCVLTSGCYAGCGGFGRNDYPTEARIGAFSDAFRSNAINIMGGGPLNNSGPDFEAMLHRGDSSPPGYGDYDVFLLRKKISELGLQ